MLLSNLKPKNRYKHTFRNLLVKDEYIKAFPDDELGKEINPKLKFVDLIHIIDKHQNIFIAIGIPNSLIREKVFQLLANYLGVNYKIIHNAWLFPKNNQINTNTLYFLYRRI